LIAYKHSTLRFWALVDRLPCPGVLDTPGKAQNEDHGKAELEQRVEAEVQRIHAHVTADMAALRDESKAALDREKRMLRDMRDHAQLEADRAKGELRDYRAELEVVALRHRALQRKSDVDGAALAAELKLRSADADRAEVRGWNCVSALPLPGARSSDIM
jgi:hypothetical protein